MSRIESAVANEFISQTPNICGGAPVIAGTRIRVSHVAFRYERERQSPDDIVHAYPHLTLAQVHAALSYYYSHREDIDKEIAAGDELLTNARIRHPSKLLDQ